MSTMLSKSIAVADELITTAPIKERISTLPDLNSFNVHRITVNGLLASLPSKTGTMQRVLCSIAQRNGKFVKTRTIIDEAWGMFGEEPDSAVSLISVYVHRLRAEGYQIKSYHSLGYALAN